MLTVSHSGTAKPVYEQLTANVSIDLLLQCNRLSETLVSQLDSIELSHNGRYTFAI